ncbi:hypothetical protein DIE22_03535 [Burkholderia sp. Bp9142]|nr:hypothetical protein DIE22_03535 [Burkholderia sp. Bp9142]
MRHIPNRAGCPFTFLAKPPRAPGTAPSNGQAVPVEAETRVVRTSVGAMQVGTGSWHSPHGGASVERQASSSGGMPPAAARGPEIKG